MTRAVTKSRKVSTKVSKGSLLGLSVVRLSGFRICQLVKKESSGRPLAGQKTLKGLFCPKEQK